MLHLIHSVLNKLIKSLLNFVCLFQFKKEEKYNMALINKALLHPKEFNVDELKLQFDKEDEEIELKKQEWAHIRKKMNIDRK